MKPTKMELINRNGCVCMLCGKDVGKHIQWHHIVPKSAGGKDTYENGSLVCPLCHVTIHDYTYGEDVYQQMTEKILTNKK